MEFKYAVWTNPKESLQKKTKKVDQNLRRKQGRLVKEKT